MFLINWQSNLITYINYPAPPRDIAYLLVKHLLQTHFSL